MVVLRWSRSTKDIRDLVPPVLEGVEDTIIDEKVVIDHPCPPRVEVPLAGGEDGTERGVNHLIAVTVMAGRGESRMEDGVIEVDRGVDIRIKAHEMGLVKVTVTVTAATAGAAMEWEETISVEIEIVIGIPDRQYPHVQSRKRKRKRKPHPYNHQQPHHSVDHPDPDPVPGEVEVP